MPLTRMDTLLHHARSSNYAVGAFECWNSANVYAIAVAAQRCSMPVIFQAGPLEYGVMGGPDTLRRIVEMYVEMTGIAAALHLDHGSTLDHVKECVDAGFTSVMLDASREPFERNLELSRAAVEIAHPHDVSVEAELGHVGGSESGLEEVHEDDALLTDPDEAVTFVRETGIDCLAVAIGTVHGDYRGEPHIRLQLLEEIASKIDVPLVLHGGSGTPPDVLSRAIELGISKINICTDIHKTWLDGIARARETLTPSVPGAFYVPVHDALVEKVCAIIRLFSARPTNVKL